MSEGVDVEPFFLKVQKIMYKPICVTFESHLLFSFVHFSWKSLGFVERSVVKCLTCEQPAEKNPAKFLLRRRKELKSNVWMGAEGDSA